MLARWWVTKVRVVRRYLWNELGSDQEIGSSPNHLRTFLYLRYSNMITLYSLSIHSSSTRAYGLRTGRLLDSLDRPPEHRTIVRVLSCMTTHPFYYLKRWCPLTDDSRRASQFRTISRDSTSLLLGASKRDSHMQETPVISRCIPAQQ